MFGVNLKFGLHVILDIEPTQRAIEIESSEVYQQLLLRDEVSNCGIPRYKRSANMGENTSSVQRMISPIRETKLPSN